MGLNFRGLLALRAVITEGTVTAAAQRLHRTQPVVSRLIAQLEAGVGFPLFRREGRRLLPTPEGLAFYRETERAFAALSEIESTARDIGQRREQTELLARAPLLVMLPSAHPCARRRHIGAADIAKDPVITVRPAAPLRARLEAFFAAKGLAPVIRGETASAVSACQLVGQGLGVTVVDPFVANLFIADPAVVIRPVSPRMEMEYLVLRTAGHGPGPLVQPFIDCVRKTARNVIDRVVVHAAVGTSGRTEATRARILSGRRLVPGKSIAGRRGS